MSDLAELSARTDNVRLGCAIRNGLPESVSVDGVEIGNHWGVETADRGSFVSLTEPGWNNDVEWISTDDGPNAGAAQVRAKLSESEYLFDVSCSIDGNMIRRSVRCEAQRPSLLQDFVCRFRFSKKLFPIGEIAGRTLEHRNTNVWYQFPVDEASVIGPLGRVTVKSTHFDGAGHFRLDTYLRDEPSGYWILHLRMMPTRSDLFWIRWHNRFGTPIKITDGAAAALMKIGPLKKALWYFAERKGGKPNIQAQPLAVVAAGTILKLESKAEFTPA